MATTPHIILAPGTTDGVDSDDIVVDKNFPAVTVYLYPQGNLGADAANLMIVAPDGSTTQATDDNGDIIFSVAEERLTDVIIAPGTYRFEVATRTLSWGIAAEYF